MYNRHAPRASAIDTRDLQRELEEYRDVIDAWVDENAQRARRLRDAHERELHNLEREYEQLIARERELSARAAENQADAERYEMEAEQAREETQAARELADGLPEQLAALRARVDDERRMLNAMRDKTNGASALAKLDALKHASKMYADRLGLRFEYGAEEKLRLVFKFVDKFAPEREFSFGVRLDGATYEIVECEPELDVIDALLRECNRTNDFGKFVRDVRKAFQAHAAAARGGRR
jgi:kinetochore protein Spc25, animal type